jgi:hyperosmotically inducible protein
MKYFNYLIGKNQGAFRWLLLFFWCILIIFTFNGCMMLAAYKSATDPRSIGTQVDDAKITAEIKLKLLEDPLTKARKIDVDTVNGVVTLTGAVESEVEIRRAVEIASSVKGVRKVVNNLRVEKRGLTSYIKDSEITLKIKTKLIQDPELKAFSIDVDTINGVVTLTGAVENRMQKRRAVEIAASVEGVKKVIDNLQIIST